MLQQTTVAAVIPYFQKFMAKWPRVELLAAAPAEAVMQQWAGLGYYRRARMLHVCAKQLVKDYDGHLPADEKSLRELPGFGPYTAAAVAAIAFDQRASVVDGNVERVVARFFAITEPLPKAKKILREKAASLLPDNRYGDYAQALMDLGATICTPRQPKCVLCPLESGCLARQQGIAETLPRRVAKVAKPIRRMLAFVIVNKRDEIFLRQRPEDGLLGGMMEVPSSPWQEMAMLDYASALRDAPVAADWRIVQGTVWHSFTHFDLEMGAAVATVSKRIKGGAWIVIENLDQQALPSVMQKIIRFALQSHKMKETA